MTLNPGDYNFPGTNRALLVSNESIYNKLVVELTTVKQENEIIQEQLRSKSSLVAEMSLRLDGLGKKRSANADATQGTDLRGANPDLLKHINGLQEQLYAERQKNRQL